MKTSTKRKAISKKKTIKELAVEYGTLDLQEIDTISKKEETEKQFKKIKNVLERIPREDKRVKLTTMKESPHCLHCYDEGAREQAEVFEKYMDLDEAVDQYHSWNTRGETTTDWATFLMWSALMIILGCIFTNLFVNNYNCGFINA